MQQPHRETEHRRPSSDANNNECTTNLVSAAGSPSANLVLCNRAEFARAMATLTALKRTASLDDIQIQAWYAVLGGFPATIINAAVLEISLTDNRFPEVGDLYQICRRCLPRPYAPFASDTDATRPTKSEIAAIAERIGLPIA
jgi:hypothetical protein